VDNPACRKFAHSTRPASRFIGWLFACSIPEGAVKKTGNGPRFSSSPLRGSPCRLDPNFPISLLEIAPWSPAARNGPMYILPTLSRPGRKRSPFMYTLLHNTPSHCRVVLGYGVKPSITHPAHLFLSFHDAIAFLGNSGSKQCRLHDRRRKASIRAATSRGSCTIAWMSSNNG
jgi:hypothetical protein